MKYNCILAVDGLDGVTKFNENKIDLVLLDKNLPKKTGIEVLK